MNGAHAWVVRSCTGLLAVAGCVGNIGDGGGAGGASPWREGTFRSHVPSDADGDDDDDDDDADDDDGSDGSATVVCIAESCYPGPAGTEGVGICKGGKRSCCGSTEQACASKSAWTACQGAVTPAVETCNGLDDDCDGEVDEADPELGAGCSTGLAGECATGKLVCAAGTLACVAGMVEVCDGKDNDCDGQIDEGTGGGYCYKGIAKGECKHGSWLCSGGILECWPSSPQSEICGDQKDNDCDGLVDECSASPPPKQPKMPPPPPPPPPSAGCAHSLCQQGTVLAPSCNWCVDLICEADPYCCNTSWDSQCIEEVATVCQNPICGGPSCPHSLCDAGAPLDAKCGSCPGIVCKDDPACCSIGWDEICIVAAEVKCNLSCP
jgi:hypothetical protein